MTCTLIKIRQLAASLSVAWRQREGKVGKHVKTGLGFLESDSLNRDG